MVGFAAGYDHKAWAAARHARAVEIGRVFAEIVRDEPSVRALWVTADTEEIGMHLWLITDPLDWEAQEHFYGAPSEQIEDRFPQDGVWVHVLNPRNHTGEVHQSLRQDAEQVPLRAG